MPYDCRVFESFYRPPLVFKGDRDQPMMGVELEVGHSQTRIADVVEDFDPFSDHLYMKDDCSITGVEIVTHPMTLDWAHDYPFDTLLEDLRSSGCSVTQDYGLHIHVGRDAFREHPNPKPRKAGRWEYFAARHNSAVHQMMWLLLFYRNARQMEKLGRRVSHWGSFRQPKLDELKRKANGQQYGSRGAVNCGNPDTFELRFFKSTLRPREFYAAVELADASVRYAAALRSEDALKGDALKWKEFTAWVGAQPAYQNLAEEISARRIR